MNDPDTQPGRTDTNVVYGMYSGLALLMDVHRPARSNGLAVVYINGCGWHAPLGYNAEPLKDTPQGLPYVATLCAGGYTVFAISHRAAPRFRYPCALEDVQRAVRFVRHHAQHYGVVPGRVGACGGSSGGHLASLLGTLAGAGNPDDPDPVNRESARVQCVVARAPPVDLLRFLDGSSGASVAGFLGMLARGEADGAYATEHHTYRDASPLHHVDASAAPFLLIHGSADDIVPCAQSTLMLAALRAVAVPAELLCIQGAGHGPSFPGAIDPPDYLGAMVRWFDQYLPTAAGTSRRHL